MKSTRDKHITFSYKCKQNFFKEKGDKINEKIENSIINCSSSGGDGS